MKSLIAVISLLLLASPLLAVDEGDCAAYERLATLYQLRNLVLQPHASDDDVDRWVGHRIERLRDPLPDGGYRWVQWVRPASDAPVAKKVHRVAAANGSGSDSFEATADHPFAVKVVVPAKRSLFNKNNPVWVGSVRIGVTAGGRTRTRSETINAWMNPDTSRTFDLGTIADSAEASIEASTAAKDSGDSVVEIHFVQARPQDDPANPAYETIRALDRLRRSGDPGEIDDEIASLEHALFPDSAQVPLTSIISDLQRADRLMHSKKPEEQEKGDRLLESVLRRVR